MNEHFESNFNAVWPSAIVFQLPAAKELRTEQANMRICLPGENSTIPQGPVYKDGCPLRLRNMAQSGLKIWFKSPFDIVKWKDPEVTA